VVRASITSCVQPQSHHMVVRAPIYTCVTCYSSSVVSFYLDTEDVSTLLYISLLIVDYS
jgi:hypothetical protein